MVNLFCNILSILLISVWPEYISESVANDKSLCLPEICLSDHPRLDMLISKTVRDAKDVTDNKVTYLTVDLINDTCGIRMEIVAHERKRLVWFDKYDNYAIVEEKPVIFENRSNIQLKELPNRKGVFPMDDLDTPPFFYDPDEWHFILKENEYARYYEGQGWIWFEYEN